MTSGAAGTAKAIGELHRRLVALDDLRPGPEVDGIFDALVALALHTPPDVAATVLADPAIAALRPGLVELSARAEYQLELAWAERIADAADPRAELERFPYVENYRRLVEVEGAHATAAARRPGRPIRRALFVGSGPLPLSPVLLAARLGVPVDSLDRDPAAVHVARRVAALDGGPVRFVVRDLLAADDLSAYDLVVLAALVGLDSAGKQRGLAHLARVCAPGTLVLARSAHLLKTLLYPEVELPAGSGGPALGLELLDVVHPRPPVINSIVLACVLP